MTVGQQAVVTNAMKAIRQYVEKKAAHELAVGDAHDFALVPATWSIFFPPEAHMGLIDVEQATVGDRHTMGVVREIGQDLLGTRKGLFRIDDLLGRAQRRESGGKCPRLVQTDEIGKEPQLTGVERCRQTFEE